LSTAQCARGITKLQLDLCGLQLDATPGVLKWGDEWDLKRGVTPEFFKINVEMYALVG